MNKLKQESRKGVIWCGDLNVAHKDIDVQNTSAKKNTAGFTN